MVWIFGVMVVGGWGLSVWAFVALPRGTDMRPIPPATRTQRGPYRWMRHPMYLGQTMGIAGLAGLAAGPWNAIAMGLVADLVQREWSLREDPERPSRR